MYNSGIKALGTTHIRMVDIIRAVTDMIEGTV